jgi:hypothetical protein
MQLDRPADPGNWENLSARIQDRHSALQEARKKAIRERKQLQKIRHKLSVIAKAPQSDHGDDWRVLVDTVEELIAGGLPPSNKELRELLLPVIDLLPEDIETPKGFNLVLREIDRFLSISPCQRHVPVQEWTPAVQEAAQLLGGRSAVLIGGDRRPHAQMALQEALQLKDLYWVPTREHQSVASFESYVARPDVAVVLLAIRWSSHSFGEVKRFCDTYGKPLVRLPYGYNPNQVASQILGQCGDRLRHQR